ncbi:uncharacterized protein METZ01_LOCUS234847 [marine metagenome]|uniref:Uncharacterized protein n=1 Tax=marine metagenome TaxID=408172 RepID=A0A382H5D6_9ZZZZ
MCRTTNRNALEVTKGSFDYSHDPEGRAVRNKKLFLNKGAFNNYQHHYISIL